MPCVYQHDFFVSYPRMPAENLLTEFVDELVKTICFLRVGERLDQPVYFDREGLQPGFVWKAELARALCHSRALLAVYTDEYFAREYCLREWDAMVDLETRRLGRTTRSMIIPIVLRAQKDEKGTFILPERMQGLQAEDYTFIYSPRQQFQNLGTRKRVGRLLARIDDLKKRSRDPNVDCDSFEVFAASPPIPPRPEPYGGTWARP